MAGGIAAMSDTELLTILLAPGTRDAPGDLLARELLGRFGSIHRLLSRRPGELTSIPGIGLAKACRVLAALEAGKRAMTAPDRVETVSSAADVWVRSPALVTEQDEVFVAIAVNSRNRVVGEWVVARGWESGINLTPRQVFTLLVKEGVTRVVFVHNHPSGDPTPSADDLRFTARLLAAAKCLDIRVLDHVIVAAGGHSSIREFARDSLEFG